MKCRAKIAQTSIWIKTCMQYCCSSFISFINCNFEGLCHIFVANTAKESKQGLPEMQRLSKHLCTQRC